MSMFGMTISHNEPLALEKDIHVLLSCFHEQGVEFHWPKKIVRFSDK